MAKEFAKLDRDLQRITERILKSKKTLHGVEIKAEELDATIQTAIERQKARRRIKPPEHH